MNSLRCYFPWFAIESHREDWQRAELVTALAREGIACQLEMKPDVDVVFVGSTGAVLDAAEGYFKDPYRRLVLGYKQCPRVPVVLYNWDLYPWVVEDRTRPDADRWEHFLGELASCTQIWCPSRPVVERTREYTGRTDAKVVLPPVPFWDHPVSRDDYVVDVMRPYPGDPGTGAVAAACKQLNIPCVETGAGLDEAEYRRVIAGARLLVSVYEEASTGSLALLEGYRLGKPVLLTDSPRHGGVDLFGDRARYVPADYVGRGAFLTFLKECYDDPHGVAPDHREWAEATYSNAAFAKRAATLLKELVG